MFYNFFPQITFECVVLDTANTGEYDIDEGGIFITSVHLQGAGWDYDNDCLADARYSLFMVYIRHEIESAIVLSMIYTSSKIILHQL